jgi:hypothetical protein
MNEWQYGNKITATVRIRRDIGLDVRPNAEVLDGKRIKASFGWEIEEDHSRYPNEIAWLIDREDDREADIVWIASGDLIEIERA